MTIEKMLTEEEQKQEMLNTIALYAFDMLRSGTNLPPELDVKNKREAKEYAEDIENKGFTLELYNRIMAGLV